MKRTVMTTLLVAGLAGAALPALAVSPAGPGPEGQAQLPPPPMPARGMQPGLELAARLNAMETLIGITEAQEPAWREYAAALLSFMEAAGPRHGPHEGAPAPQEAPQEAGTAPEGAQAPAAPPLMAERMAERALDLGARAETLKTATAALRDALEPGQLQALARAERPEPPHRGAPQ
ncbi:hypothetical protein, partial [Mangrovicoccus algicola]|nr:hypothetical protein [Mangrovicoccus algicola]